MNDIEYMKMALELAKRGRGRVNPNPLVGAIVVKNGRVIGQGWHEYFGGLHAERNALKSCREAPREPQPQEMPAPRETQGSREMPGPRESAEGATLYVTLEPCCHYGKTPPCTEAIIESKIARVVVGTLDVNPLVAGKGVEILRQNGITVDVGVLEDECQWLIRVFRKFMTTKRPFVVMKYAMTMDGKIATYAGHSRWISSEQAREQVHRLRNELTAIMVGVETVIHDDPLLTCRMENGRNPVRIVCDTHLRTPLTSKLVETAASVPTFIATACGDEQRKALYEQRGCKVIPVPELDGHIDLSGLMDILGAMDIDGVLLEGGGRLNWSALRQQIVDEVQTYIAPKIFGGTAATPVGGPGVEFPGDAVMLAPRKISRIGPDCLIESEVIYTGRKEG